MLQSTFWSKSSLNVNAPFELPRELKTPFAVSSPLSDFYEKRQNETSEEETESTSCWESGFYFVLLL